MKESLAHCEAIGGLSTFAGQGAFARAALVLRSTEDPSALLLVRRYSDDGQVEGDAISQADWEGLRKTDEALQLDPPRPVLLGSALWVFRSHYRGLDAALSDLRIAEALVGEPQIGAGGAQAGVVCEPKARAFRGTTAASAYNQAFEAARKEQWNDARYHAEVAFGLDQVMKASHVALLCLILSESGQRTRSDGYLAMARNSRGESFHTQVQEAQSLLQRDLAAPRRTPDRVSKRDEVRRQINRIRAAQMQASLRNLEKREEDAA